MNAMPQGWLLAQVEKEAELERAGVMRRLDINFVHQQLPLRIPIKREMQVELPKIPSNRVWRMLGEKGN